MGTFENACVEAEASATAMESVAKLLQRSARALTKAAREGNPVKIRQAISQIQQAAADTARNAARVELAWPLSDQDVSDYLDGEFVRELIAATAALGIKLNPLDDRLAAFPVIVQVLAQQRAVRVDAAKIATLRPTVIAERIRLQMKKPHSRPEQFIETLYKGYRLIVGHELEKGAMLLEIYDALTLLPSARREYEKAEFFRDVHLLDASGLRSTKSGAIVTFPAGTGTRGSGRAFTVMSPDGMPKSYYGIRFQESK